MKGHKSPSYHPTSGRLAPTVGLPFSSPEDQNISFRIYELNEENAEVALDNAILQSLRQNENFVFIHPDSN
jgi:hypothetical protein